MSDFKYAGAIMRLVSFLAPAIVVMLVALLCIPSHQIAWNSSSRELLESRLKKIGAALARPCQPKLVEESPLRAIFPRGFENGMGEANLDAESLVDRYGVTVNWRMAGEFEEITFYPIAIRNTVVIDPRSEECPVPLVAMIPLQPSVAASIPSLGDWSNMEAEEMMECQRERAVELLKLHGITDPVMLLSDGSVRTGPIDE